MADVASSPSRPLVIHQSLRNQSVLLVLLFALCALAWYAAENWPWTTQSMELFGAHFQLPLTALPVFFVGLILLQRLKDKALVLCPEYVLFSEGQARWKSKSTRVPYENIQEIGIESTIFQRALGVADLEIVPFGNQNSTPINMPGVRNARKIKDQILSLRPSR